MPTQRTPLLPLVGYLGETLPQWAARPIDHVYDTFFSGEDGVHDAIRGINGDCLQCLVTSFEDPEGTREAELLDFFLGWGREPFPNSSRGFLWYSPQPKGIVVAVTDQDHETHLYLLDQFKDPMTFDICLAQVREICASISEESPDGMPMMRSDLSLSPAMSTKLDSASLTEAARAIVYAYYFGSRKQLDATAEDLRRLLVWDSFGDPARAAAK